MKKITARITMSVEIPDKMYEGILKSDGDYEVTGELMELFKANGYIDEDYGDSYIPGPWIAEMEE